LGAVARYQRPDLESRLHQSRARLMADHVRVLVVGEFKQGKSLLVNALVGAPVCPVHDDIATSVATVVTHAPSPVLTVTAQAPDARTTGSSRRVRRVDVPLEAMADAVAAHVTEWGNPGNRHGVVQVEVGLPGPILETGLQFVDTPGVGGLRSVHGAATMAALPTADAVLLVSDASQEYTAPELEFLKQAIRLCPNVVCVLTKIDMYPEWRRVAELDVRHLREVGIVADLVAVSSAMRNQAVTLRDAALDAESGFPVLERYLVEQVVGQADLLARRSTVHDVMTVTEQVGESLRTEEASHRDPAATERIIQELRRAQERAVALRERSARWQLTLSDGIADLNADVDHDLRDRMREVVRVAEDEIAENGDPTRSWERHSEKLRQECASAVAANYLWATERSRELARRTALHFAEEHEAVLPALRIEEPSGQIGARGDLTVRDHEKWNLGNKALTALRGGYIGVLMFGMLGSVVGMSLINPFSVGAGVLLGGKAIADERRRIIARRQSEAKAAVRRHVDEVVFQVGKDSREMLRVVQRDLRDHYSELAEQLNRSIQESVASAERSVQATQAERDRRLTEISSELAALVDLRTRVSTLLSPAAVAPATTDPIEPPPALEPAAPVAPEDSAERHSLRVVPAEPGGGPAEAQRLIEDEPPTRRGPLPGRRALVFEDQQTGRSSRVVPMPQRRDADRPPRSAPGARVSRRAGQPQPAGSEARVPQPRPAPDPRPVPRARPAADPRPASQGRHQPATPPPNGSSTEGDGRPRPEGEPQAGRHALRRSDPAG
jgi:hypothetical protein